MKNVQQKMLKNVNSELVCGEDTDLVIEGYPRSSNSFTIQMIRFLEGNQRRLKIAHHTHSIDNLRLGVYFKKATAVLVRPPEDAILSYMIYANQTVDFAAKRYENFFRGVLNLETRPAILKFETVITDFNFIIGQINKLLIVQGSNPIPLSKDLAADTDRLNAKTRERALKVHGSNSDMRIGLPSATRNSIKEERRIEVQNYLLGNPEAERLYDAVLEFER